MYRMCTDDFYTISILYFQKPTLLQFIAVCYSTKRKFVGNIHLLFKKKIGFTKNNYYFCGNYK